MSDHLFHNRFIDNLEMEKKTNNREREREKDYRDERESKRLDNKYRIEKENSPQ